MTEEEEEEAEEEARRRRRRRPIVIVILDEQRTENDVTQIVMELTNSTNHWAMDQRSAAPVRPTTTTAADADLRAAFADLLGAVAPDERQQILGSRKQQRAEQYSRRRSQLIDSLMAGRVTA